MAGQIRIVSKLSDMKGFRVVETGNTNRRDGRLPGTKRASGLLFTATFGRPAVSKTSPALSSSLALVEPSLHGPYVAVFVGLAPAEVSENAVAQEEADTRPAQSSGRKRHPLAGAGDSSNDKNMEDPQNVHNPVGGRGLKT